MYAVTPALTCLPRPAVRGRLWLTAHEVGEHDDEARLWLHLQDGRVLGFRLPAANFGNDKLIPTLVEAVRDDMRGMLLEIRNPACGYAIPLYAAPAAPVPNLAWGHPRHQAARAFCSGLDQEVLALLARLDNHRFWSSARNYNRLAPLAPELRLRRMQAIDRFPVLVAPILLTAHHSAEAFGGKRHAWRNHDDAVIHAVDLGRDLAGALACRYGISRGMVRASVCGEMWGSTALSHERLLILLDGIPAHRRPRHAFELERVAPHMIWINREFADLADLARLGRAAFKNGWSEVWAECADRFVPLNNALADINDFLRAAMEHAGRIAPGARGLRQTALALAWIEGRGLVSLLQASHRWHVFIGKIAPHAPAETLRLPAVIGTFADAGGQAAELTDPGALAREGEEMHHCVAQYWLDCVEDGTRIFSLALTNGERATAEYHLHRRRDADDPAFGLEQLRGPCNADTSPEMASFARSIEARLNAPEAKSGRALIARSLLAGARGRDHRAVAVGRPPAVLDPRGEQELLRVLSMLAAQTGQAREPGEVLRACVAGYRHHAGPDIEEYLAHGEELTLVRERDNAFDINAVRIDWRRRKIGYVPRAENAVIAQRIDAGEPLAARIVGLHPAAETWQRLEFVIVAGHRD